MNRDEIRGKFDKGSLLWDEVFDLLKKAAPPWKSASWKNRRAEVIASYCEKCNNQERLTLQHKWHPASFSELCDRAKLTLRVEFALTNPIACPVVPPFDPMTVAQPEMIERDSCPKCTSVAVKYRQRTSDWICNGKHRYRVCGHVFQQPLKRLWSRWTHDELVGQERNRHSHQSYYVQQEWERAFVAAYSDRICHEATRLSFLDHDRYMEMRPEDIVTLCKKCAFKEDIGYAKGSMGVGRAIELVRQIIG